MILIKNILVSPSFIKPQSDCFWVRPHQDGSGTSLYMPHGTVWRKIALFGQSDGNDSDDANFQNKEIYEGDTEPTDKRMTWLDPQTDGVSNLDDTAKTTLETFVSELNDKVDVLYRLRNIGVIPGDSTTSARTIMTEDADSLVKPDVQDEDGNDVLEDSDDDSKPDVSGIEYTTSCIVAKCDTAQNFSKNRANLVNGEILFYTDRHMITVYYDGKFYSGGSSSSSSTGGLSLDDLYSLVLEKLNFTDGTSDYKVSVHTDGTLHAQQYNDTATLPGSADATWGNYVSPYLCINTIYCGGSSMNDEALVSHNFIELANGDTKDINLKGLFLLYTDCTQENADDTGFIWHILPLEGIIKAGGTFLIRGAQCHAMKSSFIKVKDYDMQWYEDNSLISFNQGCASFYLCAGNVDYESESGKLPAYDSTGTLIDEHSLRNPWNTTAKNIGYVDSCGFGTGSVCEGSSTFLVTDKSGNTVTDWSKVMFVRWYMLDPSKQGNKAYSSRSTKTLWTYIQLDRQDEYNGNSVQYYYPDWMKQKFSPLSSYDDKDFFTNKSGFRTDRPNIINITFGRQATSISASNVKASRCFNWVSVGYYDEFVEYRKSGDTEWTRVYSITDNDASNSDTIKKFIQFYGRYRWCTASGVWVTTHKVVLSGVFEKGTYEYRVGRKGDDTYFSQIMSFRVWDNSEVSSKLTFIQDTDQQGFNWIEYQVWKASADYIAKNETPAFMINTGDIAQSGNRENEWLDYHDGRQALRSIEEMFTIGNNDLCGKDATVLTDGNDATSKYNHINVLRYYTFELDPDLSYTFTWNGNEYPIYSLYSFDFGIWHFVSINSENAAATAQVYGGTATDSTFASAANAAIESWFKADLQKYQGISASEEPSGCSHVLVYMHEMPFTMLTYGFFTGTSARGGSHLNTLDSNGNYRFSRLFKKYGIRLVFGGHKHTYTISKPVYDAPEGYIGSDGKPVDSIDLMGTVTDTLSRRPVIQVQNSGDIIAAGTGINADSSGNPVARYEIVDKIDAPTYVMSQATGYKLVSNKELPSSNIYTIPWLLSYFKATKSTPKSSTENRAQHFPMYIVYTLEQDKITVEAKQIQGIWNVNITRNTASFDPNVRLTDVSAVSMTLSQASSDDLEAYGEKESDGSVSPITDPTKYIINL